MSRSKVIFMLSVLFFSGCNDRYRSDADLESVLWSIGYEQGDPIVDLDDESKEINLLVAYDKVDEPSIYPLSLSNGRIVNNSVIWDAKKDVSGVAVDCGRFILRREGSHYIAFRPDGIPVEFITWHLDRAFRHMEEIPR